MFLNFQSPTKDEYSENIFFVKTIDNEEFALKDENSLSKEQIIELKDYLTLKQM